MPTFRLVSTSGDQTFELKDVRTLVVGRGLTSDIAIYDPTISRRHAELVVGSDGVQVKDLGSSNGTFINGARITASRLALEDTVTFGKVVFRLTTPGTSAAAHQRPALAVEVGPAGGQIVRQLVVSGGAPPGITSRDRPPLGQLKVEAATGEARQAVKLQMLLEVSQKLSAELDLDRLLRAVVDVTQAAETARVASSQDEGSDPICRSVSATLPTRDERPLHRQSP
jgi:pSer/pThr/pTyr-binding forkhead associated (FHA) protein